MCIVCQLNGEINQLKKKNEELISVSISKTRTILDLNHTLYEKLGELAEQECQIRSLEKALVKLGKEQ